MRAHPQRAAGRRHPGRELEGRVGPGPGGDQRPLCRRAGDGGPPRHPQERRQGDRLQRRARPSPSWRSGDYGLAGSSSHIHSSLWERRRQDAAVLRPEGRARHVGADARVRGRAAQIRRARSPGSSRPTSTPTSASRSAPSRRPRRCGAATTAPPASGCAARARKAIRIECRIGGADLNPYLAFAALIAAGLAGIEEKLELEPAVRRRRLSVGEALPRDPEDLARGDRGAATNRRCCARPSATRWSSTMCTPRAGSSSNTTAASPTGS